MKMKSKYQHIILSTATNRAFKNLYHKYKHHWLLDEVGFYNIRNWIYKDIGDQTIMPTSLDMPKEKVGQYLHSTGNQLGDSLTYSLEKIFCGYISTEIHEKERGVDLLEKSNNRRLENIQQLNLHDNRVYISKNLLRFIDKILKEKRSFDSTCLWDKDGVIVSTVIPPVQDPEMLWSPLRLDHIYLITDSNKLSCHIYDLFKKIKTQMSDFINHRNSSTFFMQIARDANKSIDMGGDDKAILTAIHNSAMRNFQELLVNTTLYLIQEIQWNIDIDRKKIANEKQKNNNFGFKK
jgi:hypothetical protein